MFYLMINSLFIMAYLATKLTSTMTAVCGKDMPNDDFNGCIEEILERPSPVVMDII